jgi:hypothetical protein
LQEPAGLFPCRVGMARVTSHGAGLRAATIRREPNFFLICT